MSPQQESDLEEFASATLAGKTARSHARYFEALAENVTPDPTLGAYAERAATELRRCYCAAALQLLSIAVEAEERADSYRAVLVGA